MSVKMLYQGQPGASSAEVYSEGAARTTITAFTVTNPTGSAATLDVWLVPGGDALGDKNKLVNALSVPANSQTGVDVCVVQTLEKDAEIHLAASSAAALTVRICGEIHD